MTVRRDYVALAGGQLGLAAVNVAVGFLLARVATPATVGQWFFVSSLAQLGVAFTIGGVGPEVVRRLGIERVSPSSVARSAFRALVASLALVLAVVLIPGGWAIATSVSGPRPERLPWIAACLIVALLFLRAGVEFARGILRIDLATMLNGWFDRGLLAVGLAVALAASLTLSLTDVVAVQLAGIAVAGAVTLPRLRSAWRRTPGGDVDAGFRWADTHRLTASIVLQRVVMLGDIVLGAFFLSATELAQYGIALRVAALVALPVRAATMVALPHLSRGRLDGASAQSTIGSVVKLSSALSGVIVIGLIFLGRPLLEIGFGSEYVDALPLIAVLAGSQLVNSLTGPSHAALIVEHHDGVVMRHAAIGASLLVGGCWIASLIGTAPALAAFSALATVVQQLLSWNAARRLCGVRTDVFSSR
ncbi:MAG: lipopolysaccharide biosynthesis protein [Ilumatobacter sp.]|uniref:lipopolysaccharide biosynthesis protein n=1 Tax=Ilumatobacter sp. TaxID=1967498 RepID=UPI002624EF72|nr:lipopolysaccharide biosynthesis protein [Ilumatobacter sp.]MDJ0768720.1 lipopolysaccharide biosynthesis protein [Ilumatobacter sp.]